MNPETIQEWLSHPGTEYFFKQVTELIQETYKKERYMPTSINGEASTADSCAMFNAYVEGQLGGLQEAFYIKDNMVEETIQEGDDEG